MVVSVFFLLVLLLVFYHGTEDSPVLPSTPATFPPGLRESQTFRASAAGASQARGQPTGQL